MIKKLDFSIPRENLWTQSVKDGKGYYEPTNKKKTEINDISNVENYIKEYCSFGARIFIIKKVK